MGCGNCGTGKPNGCKSNGGCSTGACNRMNTYDWLANIPFANPEMACKVVEVSFNKGSRKDYYYNGNLHPYEKGELLTVEGVGGFDVGELSLSGDLVRIQLKKRGIAEDSGDIRRVIRRSNQYDVDKWRESKAREREALVRSRAIARQLRLEMKLAEVEIQADGKKATFFYTADDRVDFRELIKLYASEFKVKVEMRQIGPRQEAAKVGGIGSCGRELCCSTWLTDFKSVGTAAARYQNLSINQAKLSGQCGRLKCCLNYELDTYLDALQGFPDHADSLDTTRGRALLVKKDIFRNLMWYTLPDSSRQYPLSIKRVKEIQAMNRRNEPVTELQAEEIVSTKMAEAEPEFVDVVGQISLKSLDQKRRKKSRKKNNAPGADQAKRPEQKNRPPRPQEGNAPKEGRPRRENKSGSRPSGENKEGNRPQGENKGGNRPQGQNQQRRPKRRSPGGKTPPKTPEG